MYLVRGIFLMVLICLISCNNKKTETKTEVKIKDEKISVQSLPIIINDEKLEKENVIILDEEDNTISFTRNELNKIFILFPVFNEKNIKSPEESFLSDKVWKEYINDEGIVDNYTFGSEVGQDDFYLIYAYVHRNKGFDVERKTLTNLFRAINNMYWKLNYGGTYFGHQHQRLVAEVEYSIYLLSQNKCECSDKGFAKEKANFIKLLQNKIDKAEEENVYNEMDKVENKKKYNDRVKEFRDIIDVIKKQTVNCFYLNQLKKYEAENY